MMPTYLFRLILLGSLSLLAKKPWAELIPDALLRLIFFLAVFFLSLLVLTVVLYLAGLIVVGGKRARLTDAFLISLLGTILSNLFFIFIPYGLIALFLSIVVWLLLIKRFYETGWVGAFAVGILTIIVYLVIVIILALIFGIIAVVWELFNLSLMAFL